MSQFCYKTSSDIFYKNTCIFLGEASPPPFQQIETNPQALRNPRPILQQEEMSGNWPGGLHCFIELTALSGTC